MADIGDLGIQGGALISAGWAGRKLLGPLFDEIAEDWRRRYSDHRLRNLNRIGQKAQAKLGDSINDDGEVPPRIAAVVMDSGSWCDAEVMSEYFAGILAASRGPDVADDRGVAWANLVANLATYDVYLHYLTSMRRSGASSSVETSSSARTRSREPRCSIYPPRVS
jgi:hypothetical protein